MNLRGRTSPLQHWLQAFVVLSNEDFVSEFVDMIKIFPTKFGVSFIGCHLWNLKNFPTKFVDTCKLLEVDFE